VGKPLDVEPIQLRWQHSRQMESMPNVAPHARDVHTVRQSRRPLLYAAVTFPAVGSADQSLDAARTGDSVPPAFGSASPCGSPRPAALHGRRADRAIVRKTALARFIRARDLRAQWGPDLLRPCPGR
jgi:hypothetical protein